jgi:hypothetical protein
MKALPHYTPLHESFRSDDIITYFHGVQGIWAKEKNGGGGERVLVNTLQASLQRGMLHLEAGPQN